MDTATFLFVYCDKISIFVCFFDFILHFFAICHILSVQVLHALAQRSVVVILRIIALQGVDKRTIGLFGIRINIDAARRDFGYDPKVDVEEGFQKYYEWLSNSPFWSNKTV